MTTRTQPITLHESDVEDSCGEEGSINIPLGFSAASAIDLSPLISKKAHSPKHAQSPAHQHKGYLSVSTPERRSHRSSKRESRTRAHGFDFPAKAGANSPVESPHFRRSSGRRGVVECSSPPDTPPPVQLHFGSEGTSSNDNQVNRHDIDEVTHLRRDVESLTARTKELQRENSILRRLLAAAEEKQIQPTKQMRSVGSQAGDEAKRHTQDLVTTPTRVGFTAPVVHTARSPTAPFVPHSAEEHSSSMSLSPLPSRSDSSSDIKNPHIHRRYSTGYALMASSPYNSSRLRESHVARAPLSTAVATTGATTTKRITQDGLVITSMVDSQPYPPKVGMTSYVTRSSVDRSASAQPTLGGSPSPSPSPYATTKYRVVRSSPEDVGVRRSYGTVDASRTCFYY